MAEYNYNDIIEYIDGTYDENFNNARNWAYAHNTTFEERLDLRELPKRYFQIGSEYVEPVPPEPTEDDKKYQVRTVRNEWLNKTDFTQLADAPFSVEVKAQYAEYRQYLRDYTNGENWWLENPLSFDEWKETNE